MIHAYFIVWSGVKVDVWRRELKSDENRVMCTKP